MDARRKAGHDGGWFGYLAHLGSGAIRQAAGALAWLRDVMVGFVARVPARVQTKLLVAFLAIVALLVALGAVGLGALREANHRSDDLIRLQRKIAAYRQVQQDTQETTAQLYGVTSALQSTDDRALVAVLRQLNQFGYDLERLHFVAKDEAELLGQVREIYDRFVGVVTKVVNHVRAGQITEARELQLAESRPLANRLERLTNQLVNRAEADMLAGIAASQRSYVTSQAVVIAFALGSVALALVLGYAISWSLISPVTEIEAGLRRVAAGDLTSRVQVANRDELGALATNVNRMSAALEARTGELQESLEYQTATSELLEVISRSTSDIEPVLDTMLASAGRLCDTDSGGVAIRQDDVFRYVAGMGMNADFEALLRAQVFRIDRSSTIGRVALDKTVIHIVDAQADPDYHAVTTDIGGIRTLLGVPLFRESEVIGVIILSRTRVEAFSERQIALVKTFADQAVIAMENARLLSELTRREQELSVTFDHMGHGVLMLDAELRLTAWNRNFQRLLDVPDSFLAARPILDDYIRLLVERGEVGEGNVEAEITRYRSRAGTPWSTERTRVDGRVIEVRSNPIPGGGSVVIYSDITERKKAESEIAGARDAAEAALERQTATADILKVIASSPTDVQPVLDAVAKAAQRFCGAADAVISLREGDEFIRAAHEGSMPSVLGRSPLDRSSISGRSILDDCTIHIPDIRRLDREDLPTSQTLVANSGARAALAAPMLREGVAVGCILLRKANVGSFAPTQIELLEAFAAQAVIAIENVRLFTELREALEQQTATAEILGVISRSPTDVTPVLAAVAKAALKFCGARDAQVALRDGDHWFVAATEGPIGVIPGPRPLNRHTTPGRAILDGEVVQIADVQSAEADEFPESRNNAARLGFRSALAAPLLRDDVSIGAIALRRPEPGAFTPNQVELLKSFAAQAVIAIENVRLFTELRDSLERLKAAQANLIQAEKMASLGQLTAGIAHEIKNPLNFVNNFAGLSNELLDELKQAVDALLAEPDEDKRAELQDTMDLLTGNLAKIVEHGSRADGIVKSMLAHSRGGTGDCQTSNINGLVEEALNLAYHGARAQDQSFNVTLERDFGEDLKPIDLVPQDVTRVFLNLFGNGFYATRKRQRDGADDDYRPSVKVSTRDLGEQVEVRVRDNGIGIPLEAREKLFQPFFTTKPTGEGTGLGLSISYDIITQQHGGTIVVDSVPGEFAEFTIRLPRRGKVSYRPGGRYDR